MKGLAVTSKQRHPDWPDIPTTAEAGYPNANIMQSYGISAPPKLPAFVIAKWEKTMEEILRDPEPIAKLKNIGVSVQYLNSQAAREFVIKESDEVSRLWGLIK